MAYAGSRKTKRNMASLIELKSKDKQRLENTTKSRAFAWYVTAAVILAERGITSESLNPL
jgi:hypothetical protein